MSERVVNQQMDPAERFKIEEQGNRDIDDDKCAKRQFLAISEN